ncbi:MBL fold metallo-hydrolase [Stakelama marina]|uniref:MBL fold metallo-hydrolase n=1 Tax=Stakelama marina TaxID=2826939 RepID=A0A8T4IFL5_9SPHN|nr:MBL fold metallo-hydrolase [Stakelama marina]MBR0553363.1 MBL fold metallo-hydrolase [Stakelama marina]
MKSAGWGRRAVRIGAGLLLWLVVALCLTIVIVPRFLDRVYYRGPVSDHFDGQRFFNPDGDDSVRPPGGGSRAGFILRYLTGRDGRPAWPRHVTVEQSRPARRVGDGRMVATWVGHATVLVQADGMNILTDPIWSDNAGPFGLGPTRVARPGIRFDDLPRIDLVLLSHNHYDHLDLETLKRLWRRYRPQIVTSLGNDAILRSAGIEAQAFDWGQSTPVRRPCRGADGCTGKAFVTVTRNHHWDSRWFADRNRALWSSFVVHLPGGNLFFGGDTGFGDGKWADSAAALGPVRLALIPIGAFRFVPGQMASGSHVGPADAVRIFERLRAAHAIGIHWGTFRLSWEGYDTPPRMLKLAARCAHIGNAFSTVAIGRGVNIPAGTTPPKATRLDHDQMLACLDTPEGRKLR